MLRSAEVRITFRGSFGNRVQCHLEGRPEAASTALGFDHAVVQIDKTVGNREPQAEAAELAGHRSISLLEWSKQGSEPLAFNSNSVIYDFEMETVCIIDQDVELLGSIVQ